MGPHSSIKGAAVAAVLALFAFAAFPAFSGMKMAMPTAQGSAVAKEVYSSDRLFLVKVISIPKPIRFEKYFSVQFAIYDGRNPKRLLRDAKVTLFAGMRHGLKHGFAHGMESSPKLSENGGVFTVKGMYFHMMGPWTLKATVRADGKKDVAYLRLPCCGK